jgi:phosphohistidine phosphatase
MVIFFLRHASAGKKRATPKQDEKRNLDKDGIEQCREVGRALSAMDIQVDAILSSPLKRCTQTAALVGNELGYEGSIKLDAALRPEANYAEFRALLQKNSKFDCIMVVGHNPNLSEFCSLVLSKGKEAGAIDFKKGGAARVEHSGKDGAELTWCITPRLVRALQSNAPQASATDKSRPKTARK